MVDSRAKGRAAELKARDVLRKHTKLEWERTPMSGALDAKHKLKGDLYIPDCKNKFCVEVKHYKDDHLTSKFLTGKTPQIMEWWKQTIREAEQVSREPLLIFKYNRSKWFAALEGQNAPESPRHIILYSEILDQNIYIFLLETWLKYTTTKDFLDG